MLSVRVYIGRREIARADATNCTEEGNICNYACSGHSVASPITGEPERLHGFAIECHDRKQSAWALVAKMARGIAELEKPAGRSALSTAQRGAEDGGGRHDT